MPVVGRKPKPLGEAVNRVKPVHEWIEVEDVPFTGGPPLPRLRVNGQPWPKRTRQKWDTWRTMPHCALWGRAEWDYAFDSIEIAARFHAEEGSNTVATELRFREKVLGTCWDFRRDLRIRYVAPKTKLAAVVTVDNFAATE